MADEHVLSALRRKYAQLAGELRACHARAVDLEHDFEQVAGAIRLFRADEDVEAIFPLRRRPEPHWSHGDVWAGAALGVLRDATHPLTMREIALGIMKACNIPADIGRAIKAVQCALYTPLRKLVGDVPELHRDKPMRWSVARLPPRGRPGS